MGRRRKSLICTRCGVEFASRQSSYVHEKNQVCMPKEKRSQVLSGPAKKFRCPRCDQQFTRKYSMQQHLRYAHAGKAQQVYLCGLCPAYFRTRMDVRQHREQEHSGALRGGAQFQRIATAHRRACEVYRLIIPHRIRQTDQAMQYALPRLQPLLQRILQEKRNAKVSLILTA